MISQSAERWVDGAWAAISLEAGPLGLRLPYDGTYRLTAQVGAGPVPAGVSEAFKRLAEYMAEDTGRAGVSNRSLRVGTAMEESYQRNPAWMARAIVNSGAADLLRPYRSY